MKSCTFIGHKTGNYNGYENLLESLLTELIENYGVTHFYVMESQNFHSFCFLALLSLQKKFPHIKIYKTVFLPESEIPSNLRQNERLFFAETVEELINRVDYIISGVKYLNASVEKEITYAYDTRKEVIELINPFSSKIFADMVARNAEKPISEEESRMLERCVENAIATAKNGNLS